MSGVFRPLLCHLGYFVLFKRSGCYGKQQMSTWREWRVSNEKSVSPVGPERQRMAFACCSKQVRGQMDIFYVIFRRLSLGKFTCSFHSVHEYGRILPLSPPQFTHPPPHPHPYTLPLPTPPTPPPPPPTLPPPYVKCLMHLYLGQACKGEYFQSQPQPPNPNPKRMVTLRGP